MNLKEEIVNEARSWIDTRFHHQGRLKKSHMSKGGCDCIGLIIGIAQALKLNSKESDNRLIKYFDQKDYDRVPNNLELYETLKKHLHQINSCDIDIGDIILFKFNNLPQHVGIIGDYDNKFSLIHAFIGAKKVVEHRFDDHWQKRSCGYFRFNQIYNLKPIA